MSTPPQAGDQSGSILLRSSATSPAFAAVTTVPVTLRSLVPAPSPSTTVTGTLTGGNGRATSTGQTAYYQVQVPAGTKALNASVNTGDASNTLFAELVDPSGAAVSAAANGLLVTTPSGTNAITPEVGTQLHAVNPVAGRWTVIVDFFNTVSGTAVTQPFTVTLNDTPVTSAASGLPDSASTMPPAGKPVTAMVTVHNDGTTPEAYFVDGRLGSQATVSLAPQSTPTVTLPNLAGVVPTFLVPSHTTAIHATASSPAPLLFDFSYPFGDPDLISTTGKTATGTFTAPDVAAGEWSITPFLIGPTGVKPAKSVTATTSMTATTAAFDPAVSAPPGTCGWAAPTPRPPSRRTWSTPARASRSP